MDLLSTVSMAAGLSWASGLRLYAVLFFAGLLGRLEYIHLPAGLHVLEHPLVLAASGSMFVIEFLADKVPALDSLWDGIHTFIRIPAGALLAAWTLGDHDPAVMVAAGIVGGALAAGSHFTKAGSRAVINMSPEPFSNIATSLGEDTLVAGGLFAAFQHPAVFLVLLAVFVIFAIWLLTKFWRRLRPQKRGVNI